MSTVRIIHGDSREHVKTLAENSIDSVVTDPPYALVSITKRFRKNGAAPAKDGVYGRSSSGFMGQKWDTGETAFDPEFWAEILRVLKPGGHVLAFSGTRTYHRMAVAIEDAGFEIRDQIGWLFGSGFPKSHDVGKSIDKAAGAERAVVRTEKVRDIRNGNGRGLGDGINASSRSGPVYMERDVTEAATEAARQWQGWGTALKPAWEPVCVVRKPLIGTVAANVLEHGTGALNIDKCRVESDLSDAPLKWESPRGGIWSTDPTATATVDSRGRWPANVIHDGSDEVVAAFPESSGGHWSGETPSLAGRQRSVGPESFDLETGSAARFFYTAKADADDRLGSKHPTVKPTDLMRYLVRLVTPPNGTVLDPFAGTGSTGVACIAEGFDAILIEREAAYVADIEKRIEWARGNGKLTDQLKAERHPEESKRGQGLPLFGS